MLMTSYQFVVLEQQHADMDEAMNMKNVQNTDYQVGNIFYNVTKMVTTWKDLY